MKKYKPWNGKRKAEVAIALLKGEPLEEVSRATGQPAHVLKAWKESFLESGSAAFREGDSAKECQLESEVRRLKGKVGELVMDNDLLYEKIDRPEDGVPFHLRKVK